MKLLIRKQFETDPQFCSGLGGAHVQVFEMKGS